MSDETERLGKRLAELAARSVQAGIYVFTPFLGLAEQNILRTLTPSLPAAYTLYGGAEGCERVMARFGSEEDFGYAEDFPIVILGITPAAPKFAEPLTHRDYLGALLNLGIERQTLGDIIVREGVAYLFADEKIASYLQTELTRVRHTDVCVAPVTELPPGALYVTEDVRLPVASERLDAMVARLWNLSREDAGDLFRRSLVFCEGREVTSPSFTPKPGDIVSVRGYGRFRYQGVRGETRKGKLNAIVSKYV